MSKQNPVVWFEIYVDDMQRAKAFYETVFETSLEKIPTPVGKDIEMMGFSGKWGSENAANGALVYMKGFEAGRNSTIVYFGSEDCSIEEARVVAAGGKIEDSKQLLGEYGNMTLVIDTEGNVIGIHSMK